MDNYGEIKNLDYKDSKNIESKEVVSIGNWLGTFILSAIPLVNIIMLIVWLCSKKIPKSKKNWAIATVILILIAIFIYAILFVIILVGAVSAATYNL